MSTIASREKKAILSIQKNLGLITKNARRIMGIDYGRPLLRDCLNEYRSIMVQEQADVYYRIQRTKSSQVVK